MEIVAREDEVAHGDDAIFISLNAKKSEARKSARRKKAARGDLSASELAELFGVSSRRIQQMVNLGLLPRSNGGRYDLLASIGAFSRHLADTIDGTSAHARHRALLALRRLGGGAHTFKRDEQLS